MTDRARTLEAVVVAVTHWECGWCDLGRLCRRHREELAVALTHLGLAPAPEPLRLTSVDE